MTIALRVLRDIAEWHQPSAMDVALLRDHLGDAAGTREPDELAREAIEKSIAALRSHRAAS